MKEFFASRRAAIIATVERHFPKDVERIKVLPQAILLFQLPCWVLLNVLVAIFTLYLFRAVYMFGVNQPFRGFATWLRRAYTGIVTFYRYRVFRYNTGIIGK
jgi:hypothetical protein